MLSLGRKIYSQLIHNHLEELKSQKMAIKTLFVFLSAYLFYEHRGLKTTLSSKTVICQKVK